MKNNNDVKDLGAVMGKLDLMEEHLTHIEQKIVGNGQKGLLERTTSLETVIETHCKSQCEDVRQIKESVKVLSTKFTELKTSVDTHHSDKKAHNFWQQINVWTITIFVVGTALLIAIIPQDINAWNLIAGLLHIK